MKLFLLTFLSILLLSSIGSTYASVRITEVAWMGTSESQFGEWVELYNDSGTDTNVSGWKLYEQNGSVLVFTFSKTIPAQGYLIVERVTPSTPDPLPQINDESGTFSGGGFANTGESLILKDSSGNTIDSLLFSSGWPAGDATTKDTMQWNGTGWITAAPTPKAPTASVLTPSTEPKPVSTVILSPKKQTPKEFEPHIEFFIPSMLYSDVNSVYSAKVFLEHGETLAGKFVWNMGDGSLYTTSANRSFTHIYRYPGVYTIFLGYYKDKDDVDPILTEFIEKKVATPEVSVLLIPHKGFQFTNHDSIPLDLSLWILVLNDREIILPPLTRIAAQQEIIMPFSSLGVRTDYTGVAILETPERALIERKTSPPTLNTTQKTVSSKVSQPLLAQTYTSFEDEKINTSIDTTEIIDVKKNEKNTDITYSSTVKSIVFGAVLIVVVVLFIALERKNSKSEESSEEE